MKTLKNFNFKDKRVLLRVDINCDVHNKKVLMSDRIIEATHTIKYLQKQKAKVVIIAHQGNPGKEDFVSLKQHAKLLNKFVKIKFIENTIGEQAIKSIGKLKPGETILLENIRFLEDEFHPENPKNLLIRKLTPLFNFYINDAFSVCHREHTSITEFPKYLKSCIGISIEKELNALKKISIKNCLYILGGAKPEENIKLLIGKKVLACGLFGQLCLVAKGKNLGYQNTYLKNETLIKEDYNKFLQELKNKQENVETPIDFAVRYKNTRREFSLEEFPLDYQIDDIGLKTIKKYINIIKKSKAIYMKGPAGFSSDKKFAKGTIEILKAIASCKGFTLIGGGHLSDAIEKYKINKKKFNHISLSGGALLNYVAGKKLPGLAALGFYD